MSPKKLPPFPSDDDFEEYHCRYMPVFTQETQLELMKCLDGLAAPPIERHSAILRLEKIAATTLYMREHYADKNSSGRVRKKLVEDFLLKASELESALAEVVKQQLFPDSPDSRVSQPYFGKFKYSLQEIQEALYELPFRYEVFLGIVAADAHRPEMNPPVGARRLEGRISFVVEAAQIWIELGGPFSFNLQKRAIEEDRMDPDFPDRVEEIIIPDGVARFVQTACRDVFEKAGYEPYNDSALRTLLLRSIRKPRVNEIDD